MLAAVVFLCASLGMPQMAAWAQEPDEKLIDITEKERPEESGEAEEAEKSEESAKITNINHLLLPQKLQLVVDPWEMDGKGQIYSEEYTIKNTGDAPGTLILSGLACQTGEGSGVTVKDSPEGLHDDTNKSVYMEITFGNKDKVILSQEETSYKTEMKPGEELSLSFSGEVNENAAKSWEDGDLGVKATYSWEPEEIVRETVETQLIDNQDGKEQEKAKEQEKDEEPVAIDLGEAGEEAFLLDTWEAQEGGGICSPLYRVKNTGEEAGIFMLSELECKSAEQSGIAVQTEKEKLQEGEGGSVYMELIPDPEEQERKPEEQREKYILLPEARKDNPEASEYKAELKPGEEITFRLVGELNGVKPEELKIGDITVTAIRSWKPGEAAAE